MILIIGLALTVVAWIIQLFRTVIKKDRNLSTAFIAVYAAGCVVLAVGNFWEKDITGGILNTLDVILPVAILTILITTKKLYNQEVVRHIS